MFFVKQTFYSGKVEYLSFSTENTRKNFLEEDDDESPDFYYRAKKEVSRGSRHSAESGADVYRHKMEFSVLQAIEGGRGS